MAALNRLSTVRRRALWLAAVVMAVITAAFTPLQASAHTRLLSSTPARDSVVRARLHVPVRLLFSEPIEVSLATISITGPDGMVQQLRVRADPRDVHAVLSDWISGEAGTYRVAWHIVSADGHPINGTYEFIVDGKGAAVDSADSAVLPLPDGGATLQVDNAHRDSAVAAAQDEAWPDVPVLQAVLRAAASFFTLAAAGLLAFIGWRTSEDRRRDTHGLLKWLCAGAFVFSAAHAVAWSFYATGGAPGSGMRALATGAGRAEMARVVLTVLTLGALLLVRRTTWATVTAWLAVLATVAIGHAAAFQPMLLLPLKAIHLAAAAVWIGGLLILLRRAPAGADAAVVAETALRVSAVALAAVVLLAATGIAQSLVMLAPTRILASTYGVLALAKAGVLVVLIAMGALNKFRNLPAVVRGEAVDALRRTVIMEVAVIVLAFTLAGALAYTSPPPRTSGDVTVTRSLP